MLLFCSHGAYERTERRPCVDMQRREAGQKTGTYQTLLQGYRQIPHRNDEARYVTLLESSKIGLVCAGGYEVWWALIGVFLFFTHV